MGLDVAVRILEVASPATSPPVVRRPFWTPSLPVQASFLFRC